MSTENFEFYLGQLRHAYKWLSENSVRDQKAMAEGLLGPAIEFFEGYVTGAIIKEDYEAEDFQKEVITKIDTIIQNIGKQESPGPIEGGPISANDVRVRTFRILSYMAVGNRKIEAIKEIRTLTGIGLKEAKDLYEDTVKGVLRGHG
jgi:hypothetical protein